MKATGIVRRIDDLGRVVIPKEIRRTMRIREGDPLEIFTDREGADEIVRRWLWSNGFEIQEQEVCIDDKKPYICMSAIYTGKQTEHNPIEDMFGRFFYLEDDASDAFCRKKLKRVKVRLSAFQKIDPENEEIPALQYILDEVKKW